MSCHTFALAFATQIVEDGYDVRTIQESLDNRSVTTTRIDSHVLDPASGRSVRCPAEAVFASVVAARPRTRQLSPPSNFLPPDLPPPATAAAG